MLNWIQHDQGSIWEVMGGVNYRSLFIFWVWKGVIWPLFGDPARAQFGPFLGPCWRRTQFGPCLGPTQAPKSHAGPTPPHNLNKTPQDPAHPSPIQAKAPVSPNNWIPPTYQVTPGDRTRPWCVWGPCSNGTCMANTILNRAHPKTRQNFYIFISNHPIWWFNCPIQSQNTPHIVNKPLKNFFLLFAMT